MSALALSPFIFFQKIPHNKSRNPSTVVNLSLHRHHNHESGSKCPELRISESSSLSAFKRSTSFTHCSCFCFLASTCCRRASSCLRIKSRLYALFGALSPNVDLISFSAVQLSQPRTWLHNFTESPPIDRPKSKNELLSGYSLTLPVLSFGYLYSFPSFCNPRYFATLSTPICRDTVSKSSFVAQPLLSNGFFCLM